REFGRRLIAWLAIAGVVNGAYGQGTERRNPLLVCVTMSPDGKTVFLGGRGEIVITDRELKKETSFAVMDEYIARYLFVSKLQTSPDGQKLAIVEGKPRYVSAEATYGRIAVWNLKDHSRISRIEAERGSLIIREMVFSADGSILALASDKTVTWWSVKDGVLLGTLENATSPIRFRSDDKELQCAFASARNKVGIWKLSDQQSRVAFELDAREK